MGYLLLEGGAEFGGRMSEPDLRAIQLAGGKNEPVRILPTAAAPDNNHNRAGNNGLRWFRSLGAEDVSIVPLIDRTSAEELTVIDALQSGKLIYMLGGFPGHLADSISKSSAWEAVLEAQQNGSVVGGSSAGAMVLCQFYFDPEAGHVREGLNLIPNACVLPHHNTFGKHWAARLEEFLPGVTLIGIDERTGMLNDISQDEWSIYGQGAVTLYRGSKVETYIPGDTLAL